MASEDTFSPLKEQLNTFLPSFEIDSSQIQLLKHPSDFYKALISKISSAKIQVFISTLYIGNTENELIWTIHKALRRNPQLKFSILVDALRGTRKHPGPSTTELLAPLVKYFGHERVEVRLYHTPRLRGFWKWFLPERFNEGFGVQHMKLYGIDDEIIISGANLSHDYFTNRQDRYYVFSSPEITHYFGNIHRAICGFSYLLVPGVKENTESKYHFTWPETNSHDSPLDTSNNFHSATTEAILPLIRCGTLPGAEKCLAINVEADTVVYPLAQFFPLLAANASTETKALETVLYLLCNILSGSSWLFTAGYFNPTTRLTSHLLNAKSSGVVLTASPQANGFFNSSGISGLLPAAYTAFSRRFLRVIAESGKSSEIILREWRRGTTGEAGGWTYHAKGIWVTGPGEETPGLTIIGSSNYTKRSEELDLEMGVMIVTQNEELKGRIRDEQRWLLENSSIVEEEDLRTPERNPGWLVAVLLLIVHILGVSL